MAYSITRYTRRQAQKIGVEVKPSTVKGKKIDVIRKGKKIASVGFDGMGDYPTFMNQYGKTYAKSRRRAYKRRHEKDRHKRWSRGWLADKLLW